MKSSINISLPQPMKDWVEKQVASGGFDTVSDYFRQLVRAEQRRRIHEHIDNNLHAALDSGESTPMTQADWERIRREGRKRIVRKRKSS